MPLWSFLISSKQTEWNGAAWHHSLLTSSARNTGSSTQTRQGLGRRWRTLISLSAQRNSSRRTSLCKLGVLPGSQSFLVWSLLSPSVMVWSEEHSYLCCSFCLLLFGRSFSPRKMVGFFHLLCIHHAESIWIFTIHGYLVEWQKQIFNAVFRIN